MRLRSGYILINIIIPLYFRLTVLIGVIGLGTHGVIGTENDLARVLYKSMLTKCAVMDEKYIRIAELSEQIEKINDMIVMHQKAANNQSMTRQYTYKRNELISELETALQSLHLNVRLAAAQ